jgi:TPR repeat protein
MGYHVMNIDMPYKFDDSNSDWSLEFQGDDLVEYSCGNKSHPIEDIYLVGHNVDLRFYGYDSTKIPYQFVCEDDWNYYDEIISLLESKVSEMEWSLNSRTVGLGLSEYAISWYKKAAGYGFASAQYHLGHCYKDGDGVDQDNLQAIHWFKLAAAQEYRDALFGLGVIYSTGVGNSINDIEAFKWFKLASEKGHLDAQWNLANCYIEGKGVLQDYLQAYMWINILCELSEGRDEDALLDRQNYAKNLSDSEVIEVNKRSRAWLFNYFKASPYVAVKYQD